MQNPTNHPRPTAFLVNIAGRHTLVDGVGERLFVLNDAAARVWRELADGILPRTPAAQAFAGELAALELVPGRSLPAATEPDGNDVPCILAQAPLQVAANTSDLSPFSSDPMW